MSNITTAQMEDLLTELLDCGYADLHIIADSEYPMDILIEYTKDSGLETFGINDLCYSLFQLALGDCQQYIKDTLGELEHALEYREHEFTEEAVEQIRNLIAMEIDIHDDFESFHNYMDTYASLIRHTEIYEEYFPDVVKIFEEKTGFSLDF